MSTVLERKPISSAEVDNDLLVSAERILGYKIIPRPRVAEMFDMLGIRPFTQDTVIRYKRGRIREFSMDAALLCLVVSILATTGSILIGASLLNPINDAVSTATLLMISSTVSLTAIVWLTLHFPRGRRWELSLLSDYKKPIPEFALKMAIAIKTKIPEVILYVDELRESSDPFLVVAHEGVHHYIAVWEEPSFRATSLS